MKNFLLLLLITSLSINGFAQKEIVSKKYKIAFTAPNDLKKYDTESESVIGYENATETLAVDIEVFPVTEWSSSYISSQKFAAIDLGPRLSLENSDEEGFTCPFIKTSYVKLSYDHDENPKVPVYVLAILNKKASLVYEVTIYCYDNNADVGKKIAKSFKLLD